MKFCKAFTIAAVLFVPLLTHAQLSKVEKKLTAHVDAHYNEGLKLLEEVVNINSGSMNFDGVRKVGQIFRAKLDALGFQTKWVDGKPFGRAGHLVAEHKGKGKTLLLIGHLDTVFELASPFQQFKMVNDSTITGPGVGDMKGGDVVIIQSLQALKDNGLLKDMNIIVVMTGDEELSGKPLNLARYDLIEAAKAADIAIGSEDGAGDPKTAVVARRSSSNWELTVTGIPAHSSQIFTEAVGAGAIYEASRILNEFYEALAGEEYLTFNPGMIIGGSSVEHDKAMDGGSAYGKANIVSKQTIVSGDIRTISPEQLKKTQETMMAIVSRHRPLTKAEITFYDGYPPLAPTEGNYKLLSYLNQVSKDIGAGTVVAVNPRKAGAADISFTAAYVDMAIDGLGLRSTGGHTIDETADPRSISLQAKRASILFYRLTQDKLSAEKPR
ncbi:MAG: M20/M25/M40 family metallo-hydrolase [Cyclobacteriaceae bacterium]|nr:M20/M25/M40 family metallo-hydrolase [Cyclobacteriaceae bacterium]